MTTRHASRAGRLRRPLVLLPALVVTGLAAAALVSPPAHAAGKKLTGTITWTRTVAINEVGEFGDTRTGTETTTGSTTVKVTRNPLSHGAWNGTDKAAKYSGTYALSTTATEVTMGEVDCVVTNSSTGSGSGTAPSYGSIPNGPTKGMLLSVHPKYTGTATVTYTGQGSSPCQSGQDVDPINGTLQPTVDGRYVCFPKGTAGKIRPLSTNDLVGAWNAKKKRYVFDCTTTYPENSDGGRTVTVKISGSLKWS